MSKAWEPTVRKSQAAKRRTNSIFSSMSVAHADDEDSTGVVYHAEMDLSNGDFYTGQWADNFPTGQGKYLWKDGCMYVGEWFRGKPMGIGRFSWPSGATYEGDFKNGYMDGKGTYIGSSGDTYRGSWLMNSKHGNGIKYYVNGDYYEGEWRKGSQNGQGRYQWRSGNHYVGRWRNGVINGSGTMIWANGNRYDGCWEDGLPKGNGTFRWYDESFYVGFWSNNPKEQNGTYYPVSDALNSNKDCDPQEVFLVHLNDCKICPDEKVSTFPSRKSFHWPSSKGSSKPGRTLVNDRFSNHNLECDGSDVSDSFNANLREGEESLANLQIDDFGSRTVRLQPVRVQPVKREGVPICKGHRNFDLMLNLQLGVRHSVGRHAPATSLDLKSSAFDPKEKVWTKFPPLGSKHTPPHQSCEFRWKDYRPLVFRTLRKLFQVDPADYMLSICGNAALRELSSPGKSGSFFYLTNDDKYMIKTMKKSEGKVLLRMLPAYYNHVRAFENTLVTKFYGLHCVKLTGASQKKVRFVIMGNLFCSSYTIHRRFDLKGSSYGRTTDKPDAEIDPTTTLKDLDLNFIFRLQNIWFQNFCRLCFFFHIPLIFNLAEECILLSRTGVGLGKGSSSDISIAAVKKASHVAQLKTNCDGNKAEVESHADRSIGEKKPRMLGDDGPSMMELSGFNIKRQEFENEYDNDAEQLLVDMEFNNSDTDNERELKLSVLRIYNKRLEERKRRKAFILERNLLYPDPFEKNLSPEEKKLCQKYKVFMRFHSKKEHEELLRTVIEEHRVLKRIQDLQEARVAGCRTSTEAETYIELKRRKEAQAIPDGKFVPRTVRPKGEVDDSPHESKAIDSECKDLSSTNTEQDLVKFLDAWDINGFPEADLLSEAEKQLCGEMRILPSHYLNMLQTISIGRLNGSITQKSDAHRLFMVDSSKVDKIYDMLTKKGIAP